MAVPSDPTKPTVPISYPIIDLKTLISRSYFRSFHYPFNISSVPLPAAALPSPPRRRILVCHDFKGGYTDDDKWVQGSINAGAYAIWHWHLMDIFVYFSHNLVTLPPPGWINAGHIHGVKVLGTFIVEWEKGREICNTLLSSTESARLYAERLAELADRLRFDGWLLNFEVSLKKEQVTKLKEFVGHLSQTMHKIVPGSLVIWYDSITIDGDLKYQNQLNLRNKPFFDICDGIYCNYAWKEHYPKDSGIVAGNRRFDVYMGIDVWGRGTFGGGQWNTNVALDVLKKYDVSAAIFGPGWVYETQQGPDFQTAQNRWWCLVERSWKALQRYPNILPFYSNFDQGHGYHYYLGGLRVAGTHWNNLSSQGFQPALDCMDSSQSSMKTFIDFEDEAYIGGGCITSKGSLDINGVFSTRLFLGNITLGQQLSITYNIKLDGNSLMGLVLSLSSHPERVTKVLILQEAPISAYQLTSEYDRIIRGHRTSQQTSSIGSGWVQYESGISLSDHTLTEIGLFCCFKKTDEMNASLSNKEATITANGSSYNASLGLIRIQNSGQSIEFPSAESWIIQGEHISWSSDGEKHRVISLKITWKLKAALSLDFATYNIYVQKICNGPNSQHYSTVITPEFLATSKAELYYISALELPHGVTSINFVIQACALDGTSQDLDKSPRYQLEVEG